MKAYYFKWVPFKGPQPRAGGISSVLAKELNAELSDIPELRGRTGWIVYGRRTGWGGHLHHTKEAAFRCGVKLYEQAERRRKYFDGLVLHIADGQISSEGLSGYRETSLWEEVGMQDAPKKEKADFWREQLEDAAYEFMEGDVANKRMLLPVLKDLSDEEREAIMHYYKSEDVEDFMDRYGHRGYSPLNELKEQILNASIDQIIGYGDEYYSMK